MKKILINTVSEIDQHLRNISGSFAAQELFKVIEQAQDFYAQGQINDVLCIIFEALYSQVRDRIYKQDYDLFFQSPIGKILSNNRKIIWSHNYGVPPLGFILKFDHLIKSICNLFNSDLFCSTLFYETITIESIESRESRESTDKSWENIPPEPQEQTGFIPTHNKQGYMTTSLDCFSKNFTCCTSSSANPAKLLEIGAAYGIASLEALKNGSLVVANDIDPIHLAILSNKLTQDLKSHLETVTGIFPEELDFPENYFDGALICRVMHFFTAQRIIDSLKILRKIIKPCGKIYIVNETPYLSNWSSFIPEYTRRKAQGVKWPGVITDPDQYCPSRAGQLPPMVHWLDHETLHQALLEAGFLESEIEEIKYINRKDQFPKDLLMPSIGKESIGCCITKKLEHIN